MRRPQMFSRALDDLHAIAQAARGAPKRAERIEKRLSGIQRELESMDKRLAKMSKRLDRNVEATKDVRKAVRSMRAGVIDVAAQASRLERDGGGT